MSKTIIITGASTGIGRATALFFREKGWNVVATMRRPNAADQALKDSGALLLPLDVTSEESINAALDEALRVFSKIDVVVNNAGYGAVGPFETATQKQIRTQFETNVFGLMNVCRRIIPHFREERDGVIINVASMGGRITFPLYSLYHGTKWAVEGFTEGLSYELQPFNVRVKIIEPGPIKTDFYDRSMESTRGDGETAYDSFIARAMPNMQKAGETAPGPEVVANAIFKAATDGSWKIRYQANSRMILCLRRLLPDSMFNSIIRKAVLK